MWVGKTETYSVFKFSGSTILNFNRVVFPCIWMERNGNSKTSLLHVMVVSTTQKVTSYSLWKPSWWYTLSNCLFCTLDEITWECTERPDNSRISGRIWDLQPPCIPGNVFKKDNCPGFFILFLYYHNKYVCVCPSVCINSSVLLQRLERK
jgi:hypothetical protein